MILIHQGDDLYIPFEIERDGVAISPEDVIDVRVCIGDEVKAYSNGELTFHDNAFLYHISSIESKKYSGIIDCQVEVSYGKNEIHSEILPIKILKTKKSLL